MEKFSREKISLMAYISMIKEVEITPKPGLVDQRDNGSHKDMDINTFKKSAESIKDYFGEFYLIGKEYIKLEEKINKLRKAGMEAEEKMYEATNGVNTHKGLIFSLGLISCAIGILEEKNVISLENISNKVKEISIGITKELEVEKPQTYGEKIYRKYGIKGVRKEAEEGYLKAINIGIKNFTYYIEFLNENNALVNTLLHFMSELEDTNILGRKSLEELEYVKNTSRKAIELGGMSTIEGKNYINNLNSEYIKRNISPGGSADYIAITYFLYLILQ